MERGRVLIGVLGGAAYGSGLYSAILIALWGLLTVATLGWLMLTAGPPELEPGPDPHAAEVAAFRREIHDWDRGR